VGHRRSAVRGATALVGALLLAACSAGSGENALPPPVGVATQTPKSTASKAAAPLAPKVTVTPASTQAEPEPPGLVPLAAPRAPSEFAGDEGEFVRAARGTLTEEKVKTKLSDSKLLTLGREFCSVLSGGGLLTTKVDHWAGSRDLKKGVDTAIVLAAQRALCGDLIEGYTRLQSSEYPEPTAAEKADLARFVTALDQPDLHPVIAQIADADVAGDAADACAMDLDSEWWNSSEAKRLEGGLTEQGRMAYVVGLVSAYCPDRVDRVIDSLEDWTG
jgi:hypothetical protein